MIIIIMIKISVKSRKKIVDNIMDFEDNRPLQHVSSS